MKVKVGLDIGFGDVKMVYRNGPGCHGGGLFRAGLPSMQRWCMCPTVPKWPTRGVFGVSLSERNKSSWEGEYHGVFTYQNNRP